MKLTAGATQPLQKGRQLKRGDIARVSSGVPQQINGGSGLNVKTFGNRVVVSQKPQRNAAAGGGTAGVKWLGYLDYFPAIPTADGCYMFRYTTENNTYEACGGDTFWVAIRKLTTSTGTPTA